MWKEDFINPRSSEGFISVSWTYTSSINGQWNDNPAGIVPKMRIVKIWWSALYWHAWITFLNSWRVWTPNRLNKRLMIINTTEHSVLVSCNTFLRNDKNEEIENKQWIWKKRISRIRIRHKSYFLSTW